MFQVFVFYTIVLTVKVYPTKISSFGFRFECTPKLLRNKIVCDVIKNFGNLPI